MSKELKVTTELKKVLLDLGHISKDNNIIFSDPRCKKQAVGVKVCGLFLNENQVRNVIIKMGELGFEFINYKKGIKHITFPWGRFCGDRFIFYKHSPDKAKNNIVYSSQIKNNNNMIKLENKTLMLNLTTDVQVGPLKAKLVAHVFHSKSGTDIDFADIENVTYNGVPISDWRKFRDMNKEFGIDYDKITEDEFNKVFTKEAVEEYIKGLK